MEKVHVMDLGGEWSAFGEGLGEFTVTLPGTLDTNGIGMEDEPKLATRLTRVHTYEGEVHFRRMVKLPFQPGKRLFLDAERGRRLRLLADGKEVSASVPGTLSTSYSFEITKYAGMEVCLELVSDNRYEGWSRKSVIGASAVTDETQTNWNGILGNLGIRMEDAVFLEAVRVYPGEGFARVEVDVNGDSAFEESGVSVTLECEAFDTGVIRCSLQELEEKEYILDWVLAQDEVKEKKPGGGNFGKEEESIQDTVHSDNKKPVRRTFLFQNIKLKEDVNRWDEEEGNLYELRGTLEGDFGCHRKSVKFGVRDFGYNRELRLTINHRVFFLRGEANCCVFPEKGHPPVTLEEWKEVLAIYASYGVNCMRFHSWCPPEAAFLAADEMGMMMQPELSHWNCKDAFEEDESRRYFEMELRCVLRSLANHPSFVMLTFGNELQAGEEGHQCMDRLIKLARSLDNTRLYANSSNGHYGEKGTDGESDFYTSSNYFKEMIRATNSTMTGHLNQEYPGARHNYKEAVEKILEKGKPVFSFEVGQYEVLPDFKEIDEFHGVTRAVNLEIIREQVEKAGMLPLWEKYVEASGELSLLGYREEVEAVLRTPGMSGLSLLGLQDFPGQGTAIVGMLNCHLNPKPYDFARPERFRSFFAPVVPLLLLEKYTYESGEELCAECKLANYGKSSINAQIRWKMKQGGDVLREGFFDQALYENQGLRDVGLLHIPMDGCDAAARLTIELEVWEQDKKQGNDSGRTWSNTYPVWVYPKVSPISETTGEGPGKVRILSKLTSRSMDYVMEGGCAYLEPEPVKENLPLSIGGQFSTDFWSVGTFPIQEGGMGMVIDKTHPALKCFPTDFHSNWQWWVCSGGRPIVVPAAIHPILTVPDSYSRLKHMGLLFEARLGKGIIMVSGMGLLYKQQYPEARALLKGLVEYLNGSELPVEQEITRSELEQIVTICE